MSERSVLIDTANELAETLELKERLTSKTNKTLDELRQLIRDRQEACEVERDEARTRPAGPAKNEAPKPPARKPVDGINQPARFVGGPPRYAFQVAPGRELKCRGGLKTPGDEVRPGDVGGQVALDKLVRAKIVLRGPLANQPNHGHRRTS